MLLNLKRDLKETRQDLMASMGQTMLAKEFGATLLMAVVGLHVTEARIRKTLSLEERRQLIDEFNSRRKTIEKGIRLLRQSCKGGSGDSREKRKRAMS